MMDATETLILVSFFLLAAVLIAMSVALLLVDLKVRRRTEG